MRTPPLHISVTAERFAMKFDGQNLKQIPATSNNKPHLIILLSSDTDSKAKTTDSSKQQNYSEVLST